MAEVKDSSILIQDVETKNIMTKSTLLIIEYTFYPNSDSYQYVSFL